MREMKSTRERARACVCVCVCVCLIEDKADCQLVLSRHVGIKIKTEIKTGPVPQSVRLLVCDVWLVLSAA